MSVINVNDLQMTYKVRKKETGLRASIKSLFANDYTVVNAVGGVSFSLEEGEFAGLIGPNGAGKTTILKMLSGILHPTGGSAQVMGFVPWQRKNDFKRKFSIVMGQRSQLWWDLPAKETFLINRDIYGIDRDKFRKRLDYLTEVLAVGEKLTTQVRRLSLGERMKMELIAALLHFPGVVFLDEPTIGLDIVSQRKIREFLREINREDGVTIILTSHYMADITELCKKLIIIDNGRILYDGQMQDMFRQYGRLKTVEFTFEQPVERQLLESIGEIVEYDDVKAKFGTAGEMVPQICQAVLSKFAVSDIAIHETSMEDIICKIFSRDGNNGLANGA